MRTYSIVSHFMQRASYVFFFFFNDTATTEIYTLSLHDALPIFGVRLLRRRSGAAGGHDAGRAHLCGSRAPGGPRRHALVRSEEHTSELQSQSNLVCRLLLEKKKKSHKAISSRHQRSRAVCGERR